MCGNRTCKSVCDLSDNVACLRDAAAWKSYAVEHYLTAALSRVTWGKLCREVLLLALLSSVMIPVMTSVSISALSIALRHHGFSFSTDRSDVL